MLKQTKRNRRKTKSPAREPLRLTLPLRSVLRALAMLAFAGVVVFGAGHALNQPVHAVDIEAPFKRVTAMQIEAAVQDGLVGGFLNVDLRRLRETVRALPWVDQVQVKRRWPNRLRLTVTEQIAAARWRETGLLNTRGEMFVAKARHLPQELPHLEGPEGSEWQVAQRYLMLRGGLLEQGLLLTGVRLDARGAWTLRLAADIEVRLGRDDSDQRIARFVSIVAPLLAARSGDIEYVDMRYSNGFAIGWSSGNDARLAARDEVETDA